MANTKTGKKSLCIVEVDRGGTTLKKIGAKDKNIQTKISAYISFCDTGNYKKYGEYFDYEFLGFRLLWITENQKRLQDVLDLCAKEETGDLVWLSTIGDIQKDGAFGQIWTVPTKKEKQKLVKEGV